MGRGFLNVAERDPGINCAVVMNACRKVRPDGLSDPGPAGDPADCAPGAVPVQRAAAGA